ncbi:hypothetical protein RF11_04824 [Thelohanellus kitauei]|uniref:Tc1-like transposase DDE domain-containing protein n=1 Tax=Thelohanellus kitauei TaxID=669202 RepID=A0A0C2JV26_THEKT|nr:hypothetical protein RF11_04824 [Thelohanellus kitauei]
METDDALPQSEVQSQLQDPRFAINQTQIREKPEEATTVDKDDVSLLTNEIKDVIRKVMNDNETIYVEDIKDKLPIVVYTETIFEWLNILGLSFKLIRPIKERKNTPDVKFARRDYSDWLSRLEYSYKKKNVIYIGECVFGVLIFRNEAWPNMYVNLEQVVRRPPRKITLQVAMNTQGILHCQILIHEPNSEDRSRFLRETMFYLDQERYVLVIDSTNFHHGNTLPAEVNIEIKNLPPHSPMLNPCEDIFSMIISKIPRNSQPTNIDQVIRRILDALDGISGRDCENSIIRCDLLIFKTRNLEDF